MFEWKELKIDALPADILTGGYVFKYNDYFSHVANYTGNPIVWLGHLIDGASILYRKPEPEAPRHEEIMSKFWLMGDVWVKVLSYSIGRETCYGWLESKGYVWGTAECFIGCESTEIPPEAK